MSAVEVTAEAIVWWRAHRPADWNQAKHLENPEVNCPTNSDKALARAVARHTQARIEAAMKVAAESHHP